MKRTGTASALLIFAFSLILSACTAGNTDNASGADNTEDNGPVRVQQTMPDRDRNDDNNEAVASRLERLAESVPEVKNANCVVFGDTAIVGIDVGDNLDRSRVGTIKYAVAEALRKDPDGVNALVTADMDLNNRIQEIGTDIRNGRPLSGFAEELADLVGRIIPQLPRDVQERETAPPNPQAATQEQGVKNAGNR